MGVAVVLVGVGVAWLLSQSRGTPSVTPPRVEVLPKPQPQVTAPKQQTPPQNNANGITPGQGVGLLLKAAGDIGKGLTGDSWGTVGGIAGLGVIALTPSAALGGLGIVGAQAGNLGRLAGRDIDRALGGDGKTGVGMVWQVSGFAAGLTLAVAGLAAVPFVGQALLLVVGVGALIDDAVRLGYGQTGVRNELLADARKRFAGIHDRFKVLVEREQVGALNDPGVREDVRKRAAWAAIGYMQQDAALRAVSWQARPRGLGQSADSHWRWGRDRGRFVEDMNSLRAAVDAEFLVAGTDPGDWWSYGVRMCNVEGYLRCMQEPPGFGQTHEAHARWWQTRGGFAASAVHANGDVTIDGARVDWRASQAQGRPILTGG